MRLYINEHYFISVLENNGIYNCQIMNLVHGIGGYSAYVTEKGQSDIVACIVNNGFNKTAIIATTLADVFNFHLECLLELWGYTGGVIVFPDETDYYDTSEDVTL